MTNKINTNNTIETYINYLKHKEANENISNCIALEKARDIKISVSDMLDCLWIRDVLPAVHGEENKRFKYLVFFEGVIMNKGGNNNGNNTRNRRIKKGTY